MLNKLTEKIFRKKNINSEFLININSLEDLKYFNGVNQILEVLKKHNKSTKLMLVGGCVRKLLNKEKIDDIDIAININP